MPGHVVSVGKGLSTAFVALDPLPDVVADSLVLNNRGGRSTPVLALVALEWQTGEMKK